jgi:hypothetical protein
MQRMNEAQGGEGVSRLQASLHYSTKVLAPKHYRILLSTSLEEELQEVILVPWCYHSN